MGARMNGMPAPVYGQYLRDPRLALAQQLSQQGADFSPIRSPFQGLARLGAGLLGGLDRQKLEGEYAKRGEDYRSALANALAPRQEMNNTPQVDPTGEPMAGVPRMNSRNPTMVEIGQALMANPDLAEAGLGLATRGIETADARKYQTGEREASQGWQAGQAQMGRDHQTSERLGSQGFQTERQERGFGHQREMQEDNQAFQGGENAASRALQRSLQAGSQAFQAQQNALNRELEARKATAASALSQGKLTDEQSKAWGFADRMVASDNVLNDLAARGYSPSLAEKTRGAIPGVGNFMVSKDYQQFDQAQRDFINAVLRRESGAVISDAEFDNARKQYFPQPGDSPEVLAQKAANRRVAIGAISRSAGPQYRAPVHAAPEVQGPMPAGSASPPPDAISQLRGNPSPENRAYFDEVFGAGMADRVLSTRMSGAR